MFREEENHVALFIDWDNLAISTAADMGGATPDLRAIIRVAQRYGTILLARAYAEWQVPSDRLNVYRSGVDPIYAPTFRFEPDPVGQMPRGKSLADPCLVADCIDNLHLLPSVNHFVLVSGDKDLIPIVRLVQLRGRRVVVIGPDYVAAILREMADEYISYRSIVEASDGTASPEPPVIPGRRGRRPIQTSRGSTPAIGPGLAAAPAAAPTTASIQPAPTPAAVSAPPRLTRQNIQSTVASAPAPVNAPQPIIPQPQPAPSVAPIIPPAPRQSVSEPIIPPPSRQRSSEPAAAPSFGSAAGEDEPSGSPIVATASTEDIAKLFKTIEQILREREAKGRPELRATNLKDLLMARISSFDESKYGFGKFRDLLAAAEKANVIDMVRRGPVHWVMLPKRRDGGESARPVEPKPELPPMSPILPFLAPFSTPALAPVVTPTPVPAAVSMGAPVVDPEQTLEVIRFINELGTRSRWLTFTYVLTNLIEHLSQSLPPQAAENEARGVLNRLVQDNILRIDREPREIEVAGARHRVRMCHLEEENELVKSVVASAASASTELVPADGESVASPIAEDLSSTLDTEAPVASEPAVVVHHTPAVVVSAAATPARSPWLAPLPDELLMPTVKSPVAVISPVVVARPAAASVVVPVAVPEAPAPAAEPVAVVAPVSPVIPIREPASAPRAVEAVDVKGELAEPSEEAEEAGGPESSAAAPTSERPSLEVVFAALREVVRQATGAGRSRAGAASVKTRLGRSLGTFDERAYGFSKFKDFLVAAQREGYVRVDAVGPRTQVTLAPDGQV